MKHGRSIFVAVLVCMLTAGGTMFAHHGGAAYDGKVTLTLKATVTDYRYVNPHTQIYFDATDDKGKVVHWSCETANPAMLTRQGWGRDTLKPGDQVTIAGHPAKTGAKVMVLDKLTLANGQELEGKQLH